MQNLDILVRCTGFLHTEKNHSILEVQEVLLHQENPDALVGHWARTNLWDLVVLYEIALVDQVVQLVLSVLERQHLDFLFHPSLQAILFLLEILASLGFLGNHWVQADLVLRGDPDCQEGLEVQKDRDCCFCSYWGSGSPSYRFCSFVC